MGQERTEEAGPILHEAFDNLLRNMGPGDSNTLIAFGRLLGYYKSVERTDDAGALIADYMALFQQRRQSASATITALRRIIHDPSWPAEVFEGAIPAAEYCASLLPKDGLAKMRLGIVLYRCGRFAEALPILSDADAMVEGKTATGASYLVMVNARLGRRDEAEAAMKRLEEILRQSAQPGVETSALATEARKTLGAGAASAAPQP